MSNVEKSKKHVPGYKTPLGIIVYLLVAVWLAVFFTGVTKYSHAPLNLVWGWCPDVLIWFNVMWVLGMVLSYFLYFKVGGKKGL